MAENENYVLAPGGIPAQLGEDADKWKTIFTEEINADGITTLQREKAYAEGNIAHHAGLKSQFYLVCTKSGTTSSNPLDVSSATLGASMPDGTVTWKVAQICDINSLPAAAKSGSYNDLKDKPTIPSYSAATQSANGLMSADDKKKLDGIATGANEYSHPTSSGNKHIPSGGSAGQFLKWSADGTAVWAADNNTTYTNMTAATASAAGKAGLVPAPAAGAQAKFLRGDGTWQIPTDTNTDTKVTANINNPTTGTWFYPTWVKEESTGVVNISDALKNYVLEGTATAEGAAYIQIGNAIAKGTDKNKTGHIRVYGDTAKYHQINCASGATANITHTLPNTSGTVLNSGTTSFTAALTSGTKIGTLKINGNSYDIYCETNTNTTYSAMAAATADAAGKAGLVPAPAKGAQGKYLRGDGTWQTPTNTTYSAATQSANGLMSAADKTKLDGIATGANAYSHPTSSGNKHIPSGGSSGQFLKWSADGTAVWAADNNTTYSNMTAATADAAGKAGLVPAPAKGAQGKYLRGDGTWQTPTNTTYSAATQSANGLMSAADKTKLDGIATGANAYSHPTSSGNKHIPSGGSSGQILRWSADGTATWGADNNTTYSNMTAATASAAGKAGLVPAPAAGAQAKFLRGDGTWQTPTAGAVLSESKYNTDGSWYRVWADGFIEQGGVNIVNTRSVTFLKPFSNTNYSVVVGIEYEGAQYGYDNIYGKTTTGFNFYDADSSSTAMTRRYYACGK